MKKVSLKQAPKKIVTRCSELPLLFACKFAITNPDKLQEVRVEFEQAGIGTDVHAAIQHTVETGEIDLRKIERKYGEQDVDRAKMLFTNGLKVVEEAKRDMKNPQFEQEIYFETQCFSVSGHVDVLDVSPDTAYVLDFKTGRTRDDHYHQMLGYAVGAWTKMGRPSKFTVHVAYVYLETGEVTSFDVTVADMEAWIKEMDTLAEYYVVNRRCVYCRLNNTCPAFRDYLKGSMTLLLGVAKLPEVRIRKLSEEARAKLATALKMGSYAVQRIREAIKNDALAHGEIKLGNGDKFIIRSREYKTLLTSKALPVISKYVSAKDLTNATRLSLNDLVASAARRVKGPMRKVIREEFVRKLKEAGAVVVTDTPYLETVIEESRCHKTKKTPSRNTTPRKGR